MKRGGRVRVRCCRKSGAQAGGASVGDRPIILASHDLVERLHSCRPMCAHITQWATAELHLE